VKSVVREAEDEGEGLSCLLFSTLSFLAKRQRSYLLLYQTSLPRLVLAAYILKKTFDMYHKWFSKLRVAVLLNLPFH